MAKIFEVGGCVRDEILNLTPKDRDYVVVGATESDIQEMISQGYSLVGNDFPVFLHPETKEEYALARIERKVGHGYNGFEFETKNVTLQDDCSRRDLTINAIAKDPETGEYVDFFGGMQDLKNKVLRHVGDSFKEDPVRVLRLARFKARYASFTVDQKTIQLCKDMGQAGELGHLTAERIIKEFEKGFSERKNWIMPEFLIENDLMKYVFDHPYTQNIDWKTNLIMFQYFLKYDADVKAKFAVLFFNEDRTHLQSFLKKYRFPSELVDFSKNFSKLDLSKLQSREPEDVLAVMKTFWFTNLTRDSEWLVQFGQALNKFNAKEYHRLAQNMMSSINSAEVINGSDLQPAQAINNAKLEFLKHNIHYLDFKDTGPFVAEGTVINSEDYTHDVQIRVTGDFSSKEQHHAYVKALAEIINRGLLKNVHS